MIASFRYAHLKRIRNIPSSKGHKYIQGNRGYCYLIDKINNSGNISSHQINTKNIFFPGTKRNYFTSLYNNVKGKEELKGDMENLYNNIITSNWNDSVYLVLNIPIWEGRLNDIEEKIKGYENDKSIIDQKKKINELFDVLFILEDLRDHINEILEQSSRSTGLAGTHVLASFKIQNINEHIEFLKSRYEELLSSYPAYKYQINLVLGKGLALLRQKYSFNWKHMHDFFF
ncbi:hypothetical protein YYC_00333 [Plasmodium yoelii 17X]|uniref:Respiratory chain complex 2 associated protein 4 n=4 Tax=Plasmodium yoelii TaxID=5861 RepID=A0AAF0B7D8_PLAYO|nr:conserved protein, unknown function [Plasmodium yoelii]ETB62622.1 hypothetical protein YYC_00333 [Plasmodium yoelii 17X]WBY60389.1 respiratory chain complex 2 associated protein 4 [Plasmodium yoelii yoelii]CDU20262.1 conserved Plasmodium protein, unknown function [Plasmodium yoelii]VTZ81020.1 conserved protein, unknown function [Plasmodium yoelii]|eukprot:XP_729065.2 conserved protein, unknown function [Plasmodium yoelii]